MFPNENKEYLKSFRKFEIKLQLLKKQKQELRIKIENVKAIKYSDMPKGSGEQSDLSDIIVQLENLEERINELEIIINNRFIKIRDAIVNMENVGESSIIHKRYIEGKDWDTIATEIGYSWTQTHNTQQSTYKYKVMKQNGI